MSQFDAPEYATVFFERYASVINEAIELGFQQCDAMYTLYLGSFDKQWQPFPAAYRTSFLHHSINNCLKEKLGAFEDVRVVENGSHLEFVFQECARLKVNKANDDLSLCTNNGTGKEQAYRYPSGPGLVFGYADITPIYLVYRMRKDGSLWDVKLMKYDFNERQWHVGIDGSNPDAIRPIVFNTPVAPTIAPSELPVINLRTKPGA